MPRMRNSHSSSNTRASCERQPRSLVDFLERERIELRHDLVHEPCTIANCALMLALPSPVPSMMLSVRVATFAPGLRAGARIIASDALRSERFASRLDRA